MPMKKFTLILALILCAFTGVHALKVVNAAPSMKTESVYLQSSTSVVDNDDAPKFTLTGKVLSARNLENGAQVDIYSVLGARVHSYVYKGNPETLNLSKGIYIVRSGKFTQKIIL
ncbi:MAG: T9SS type A sorting domain-containing protein [Bacteroidia bacterium]|nr:T9SS type A sorting domain-containing protein [Bacteroidia bacterium]